MQPVGIRQLRSHLSEYLRLVRGGERILISSHGEVVAELRPPEPDQDPGIPHGLRELVRRGLAHAAVRNDPSSYQTQRRVLTTTTARELLDWDRDAPAWRRARLLAPFCSVYRGA